MNPFEEQEHEADVLDVAARNTQIFIDDKVREASRGAKLAPTGFCLSPDCGEQLVTNEELEAWRESGFPENTPRFCGVGCRDRLQHYQRMRDINGR